MIPDHVTINLRPEHFGDAEREFAALPGMAASTFRFETGVLGLRIRNQVGWISLLPFQGQQIWDAEFHGRRLTMHTMFPEPFPIDDYLRTYGAFLIHCGVAAMGNPGPEDRHPLHGELPNAPYQTAQLIVGRDEAGDFMGLTGSYRHTVAFSHNYVATPTVRLWAASGRIRVDLSVRNLRNVPMELMYLAHINFRPVDGAVLVDAAPDDPEHMRVRTPAPSQFATSLRYRALLEQLKADPGLHRTIDPALGMDPEVVIALDPKAGDDGWTQAMQILPNGSADFVSHRPAELPFAIRWISRTPDHDALGFCSPATAEPNGYTAEKARGHLRMVPAQGEFHCSMEFGGLLPEEAGEMRESIEATRRSSSPTG